MFDGNWLVLTPVAGAVTAALAFLPLPGWRAVIVVVVVALGAITSRTSSSASASP